MPYQPLIPLATDKKSVSQGDIKNNFTLLEDTYNGINNKIILKEQAVSPASAVNQMALYTKVNAHGVTSLFVLPETGAGNEVDITTAHHAVNGWCLLPCGILMLWAYTTVGPSPANVTYTYASDVTFPGFNPALPYPHNAQVTPYVTPPSTPPNSPLSITAISNTYITIHNASSKALGVYISIIGSK